MAKGRKVPTPVKRRLVFLESVADGSEKKRKVILKEGYKARIAQLNQIVSTPDLKKKRLVAEAKKIVGSYRTLKKKQFD